ncbi:MAG: alpha-hydroxy-acid oxidizing protein [Bacteroidia bacterium]|nr:alpha-hydroxy-acid oxidizing protein [Bacteroidia bacterium]
MPNPLLEIYPSVQDLEQLARDRVPHLSWEYLQSGTGDEHALDRNRKAFADVSLPPRVMRGKLQPDLSVSLFGKNYALPFGIAPVGLTGLMWPRAEYFLAATAKKYGIPYCLSTVATETPETIGPLVGEQGWFQLYPPVMKDVRADLLKRAADSGFHTLVMTADVPVPSRRERTKRAGLRMPPKTTFKMILDTLAHPKWAMGTIKNGTPRLRTIEKYTPEKSREAATAYVNQNLGGNLDWDYLKEVRDLWQGPVILKGVMHPEDALQAVASGVDGIVVSNHGGRQFDATPASLEVLPDIVSAVKGKTAILFDSGIRSGLDILKALHLGAEFVLLGRAFIYGVIAMEQKGSDHVVDILVDELKNNMMQLGRERL